MRIKTTILCFITLLALTYNTFAQQVFRRHFIIAYDVSTPFKNAEKQCPEYKQALIDLFLNRTIIGYNEANKDNLLTEKGNDVIFFDKLNDNISFFHFNVARSDFNDLRWAASNYDEKNIVSSFTGSFIKDKGFDWSNANVNISDYFNTAFALQPMPANFDGGVSMSNFVYPLILDKLDAQTYAEEYILILLSDFLTGSMLGNTKDLDRVRDIYCVPYNTKLPPNSPVSYIKKRIDYLTSQYYKMDYFQYSFLSANSNNKIAVIAFKIKPKIGVLTPEDFAVFMDSNLDLFQQSYEGSEFKTSEAKIKFMHNKTLVPTELQMTIILPSKDSEKIIFNDVIAKKNEEGKWISLYTNNNKLMHFDESTLTYYIPKLNIELKEIADKKNFENLVVKYKFKTKYEVPEAQSIGFIHKTERALPIENINYKTQTSIIIMNYVVIPLGILLLIFIVILILANRGKPQGLLFNIKFSWDSFEKTDYRTDGKLITDYKSWNPEEQKVDFSPVHGIVFFNSNSYPFNWKSQIKLQLKIDKPLNGFELFLKRNHDEIKEFNKDNPMCIKQENGQFSFLVGIRQTDVTKQINKPELVKFSIIADLLDTCVFIKSEIRKTVPYTFHIGPDLQDDWVAFDPGTTGSCVAVGSEAGNIRISKGHNGAEIIPSVITFVKNQPYDGPQKYDNQHIPDYEYGIIADNLRILDKERYVGFKSIKKMLGFKTEPKITFNNGVALSLKGKDLASLLVKGIYSKDIGEKIKSVKTEFEKLYNADDSKRNKIFNPLRAVVSIPNNFTASKIQDTIDCIADLKQFKEIRYVYEAEAILFYYLSTHKVQDSEAILLFDMGGATINATVARVKKITEGNNITYDINILGKIGYGIGGDAIDYCIIKFLMDFPREFYNLSKLDIIENKEKLSKLAFELKDYNKYRIVKNYNNKSNFLITADDLERCVKDHLGIEISIAKKETTDETTGRTTTEYTSPMYKHFLKDKNSEYPLFKHKYFTDIIYKNVTDAVREVLGLANVTVDKVIFSGRSTAFPKIKETVRAQLNSSCKSIEFGFEELKTAVAKGACWYGIHNSSVKLHYLKTAASFGFKRTHDSDGSDVKFHKLIAMGQNFDTTHRFCQGKENISDLFGFDGKKVNFYQIMGKDADAILSQEQKHKYSKIATIRIDQPTTEIAMQVNKNDEINCFVRLQSNRVLSEKGAVADQEINEANAEHYTWIITQ